MVFRLGDDSLDSTTASRAALFTAFAPASAIGRGMSPTSRAKSPEMALAHVIGDKAEQAYRRSDALEKRRKLMEAWAAFCEPKGSGNVVQIRKAVTTR